MVVSASVVDPVYSVVDSVVDVEEEPKEIPPQRVDQGVPSNCAVRAVNRGLNGRQHVYKVLCLRGGDAAEVHAVEDVDRSACGRMQRARPFLLRGGHHLTLTLTLMLLLHVLRAQTAPCGGQTQITQERVNPGPALLPFNLRRRATPVGSARGL